MRILALATLLVLALAANLPAGAGETHPFSVHDMLAMDRISDPQVSPCGKYVAFTVRVTDLEANRGRTDIWMVGVDGKGLRRLTTHPENDWNPRWDPSGDGIFFLSSRSGSVQVWRLPLAGGEARQVTDLPLDAGNLVVSPDGKHLAVTVRVFPECGGDLACTKKKLEERENRKASGRLYTKLFVRHWDTWEDGRRSHLVVVDREGKHPVDVMAGMDTDTPSTPFGGPEEIAFTPDGKELVFSAKPEMGSEEAWSTNFDLWAVPIDGSAKPRNLTAENEAWDTQPVFSPDGKTLAYLAMKVPGYESDRYRVVLLDWKTGKRRVLTEGWDRSPRSIAWSADGKELYATADNLGQTSLFAIDARTGKVRELVHDGTCHAPAPAGPFVVFGRDSLSSPVELWRVRPDGKDLARITHLNDGKVAAARMGEYEQFTFEGWNGETVWGYLVKPADFEPGRKYPVAFLVHGGPQGSFGNHFHYRWNPQAYAGHGYAAVMIDFHGSTGYGQAFTDSIRGDWGGKPLEDLRKGLAAALAKYPFLDGDRVCALGASFGGYMINWIAGNWPDRFRCLVCHDGNLDERMAYFDTEELWFPERDHEGTPWENPEGYEKHNPVNFVKNWKTPMLVIHGAQDYRVVDTQGLATFNALQRRGIPSQLLYFPDENHWVLKPANSILWHDTVLAWIDRWTK